MSVDLDNDEMRARGCGAADPRVARLMKRIDKALGKRPTVDYTPETYEPHAFTPIADNRGFCAQCGRERNQPWHRRAP